MCALRDAHILGIGIVSDITDNIGDVELTIFELVTCMGFGDCRKALGRVLDASKFGHIPQWGKCS